MNTVTKNNLEYLVKQINIVSKNPVETYNKSSFKINLLRIKNPGEKYNVNSNIGNYHLSGAYGGWKLEQIVNEHGGTKDIFNSGYTTKRELNSQLHAFLTGLETYRDTNQEGK